MGIAEIVILALLIGLSLRRVFFALFAPLVRKDVGRCESCPYVDRCEKKR